MNNLSISKKEVVVLFDLLKLSNMPCSLTNMPTITTKEYAMISKAFYESRVIVSSERGIKVDKGIECFLTPIMVANRVMLFNQGEDKGCRLNLSVYFSENRIVALRDNDDTIDFLSIDTLGEFFLLLPEIEHISKNVGAYISYWLFENDMGVAHCATFEQKSDVVNVIDSKRQKNKDQAEESKITMSVLQYNTFFKKKIKEVCDVFNC